MPIIPEWTADWRLDAGSLEWLNKKHFTEQLAAARVNIANAGMADVAYLDVGLWRPTVQLLSGPTSDGSKGSFNPTNMGIELWWNWDARARGLILRHELQHMLLFCAGREWRYFGHGTAAPAGADPYLNMLHSLGREVYFEGSAYDPLRDWPR